MKEYRYELLNEINIKDLPLLYKNAFNENRTLNEIKGKFNSSRMDCTEWFTFIAYDSKNSPAGLYAIFPFLISYNGEQILTGQVGDILIHSEHRKQRDLFYNLANHTHEYAKSKGIKFVFAFVFGTKGSYPLLTRYLDFIDNEMYRGYIMKINTLPISYWTKKYKLLLFLYKPYFNLVKKLFLSKHKSFLNTHLDIGYGQIEKTEKFISYKKGFSNCEILEVNGVRFLIKINEDGSMGVGDVDKLSQKEILKGIQRLKYISFILGIRVIQFEMSEGHILDKILKNKTESNQNRRLLLLKLDQTINIDNFKFTYSELDTF
jgi:hypothetical protein